MAAADNKAVLQRYAEEFLNQGNLAILNEVVAPTGKLMTMTATVFYRLRGGQIAEAWGDWDQLGVQQQLGAK